MNYKKIYDLIIERAKQRLHVQGYKEKHHIIPKCLGGSNKVENLVELTAREHFICHKLLTKIYPNNGKLKYALWCMCNQRNSSQFKRYKVTAKVYESIRREAQGFLKTRVITKEWRRKNSEAQKALAKQPGYYNKGNTQPRTQKLKEHLSRKTKNITWNQKYGEEKANLLRLNVSKIHKNKILSNNTKQKISQTKLRANKALKIIQLIREETVVRVWENYRVLLQLNPTWKIGAIRAVCNNKGNSAYGYNWKYV